jgi:CHAT domain-containing protein
MCDILVVEDTPDVRETLEGCLKDERYVVTSTGSDSEALNFIVSKRFDFALIDVHLYHDGEEDQSGVSLALAFRTLAPDVHIILLSQYEKTKQITRAIRYHGVSDFIDKKSDDWVEQVIDTVKRLCKEDQSPGFNIDTQFILSLTINQLSTIRVHGQHVYAGRTAEILQIEVASYARQADIAWRDKHNFRVLVQQIGQKLWQEIFVRHQTINTAYTQADDKGQLLSISVEAPREFLQIPFEFIRNSQEYLVLSHPFARFIYGTIPKVKALSPSLLALTKKLRILIIGSNTEADYLRRIDGVDTEVNDLYSYLRFKQNYIPAEIELIPTESATYENVKSEIRRHNYDIVHYAGHGYYNIDSPEDSSIFLWEKANKQGKIIEISANELKLLFEQSNARLVYLSCCFGTATGDKMKLIDDDFLGLADAIAQAGIPSIIGFRWPVSDLGAPKFALAFYRSLLESGSPEIALWTARRELAAKNRNDDTWLSPILIHHR